MTTFAAPHKGKIMVQSFFGPRIVDGKPGFHPGIDVTSDDPTGPLYSMHSGTVVAQWSYQNGTQNILVVSDDGTGILYSGLSKNDKVPVGSSVAAGDEIGTAGKTDAGRYHTHIEIVTPQGVARMGLVRGQDAGGKSIWLFNGRPLSDSTNAEVGQQYTNATRTGLPKNINGDAYRQDVLIPGDLVVPWTQVSPNASAQLPQISKWSRATWDAANQLHPYLAQTLQADQLLSGANSFNPPGLSPEEINRFYADTAKPGADPHVSLAAGVPRVADGIANGLTPSGIPRTYASGPIRYLDSTNAAQQLFAKVPASGVPAFPSRTSPSGTISPQSSPASREPQKRSAVPGDPSWASAQGTASATSAFPPTAAYSPTGNSFGNFPRVSSVGAPSPTAFGAPGSGPPTAADFHALAQGIARLFGGPGQFVGNGLMPSADAASLPGPSSGPTAPDLPGYQPQAATGGKPGRYLRGQIAGGPAASIFDSGAAAVPLVPPNDGLASDRSASFNDRFGNWISSPDTAPRQAAPADDGSIPATAVRMLSSPILPSDPALRAAIINQAAAELSPQADGPVGIFSGQPMKLLPPPIFDPPNSSGSGAGDGDDWFNRWFLPLIRK
jgi:hypothetical protein